MAAKQRLNSNLQRRLDQLRASFKDELTKMIAQINEKWQTLAAQENSNAITMQACDELYHIVHRVTGSAGTLGYVEISRLTAPLEGLLSGLRRRGDGVMQTEIKQIELFIRQLISYWKQEDQSPAHSAQDINTPEHCDTGLLFVLTSDKSLAHMIQQQLQFFDYTVSCFNALAELEQALTSTLPAVTIVDSDLEPAAENDWLHRLAKRTSVMVLSSRADVSARLQAVWARCSAYLVKPLDINELVHWLERLTPQSPIDTYQVLIVNASESLADSYAVALQHAGIDTAVLTKPLAILERLAAQQPDLILMDVYMPECNGIDLVQVIRQHRVYRDIPVVFLAAEQDVSRQLAVKSLGGDDFLTTPIGSEPLVNAVLSRIERARAIQASIDRDSRTGLLHYVRFKQRLSIELARAQRQGLTLTLGILDINGFDAINEKYGHLSGDAVLQAIGRFLTRRLRKTDIIGRYGGDQFSVIFTHTHVDMASKVLQEICETFKQIAHGADEEVFNVSISYGVAGCDNSEGLASLLENVARSLAVAKHENKQIAQA